MYLPLSTQIMTSLWFIFPSSARRGRCFANTSLNSFQRYHLTFYLSTRGLKKHVNFEMVSLGINCAIHFDVIWQKYSKQSLRVSVFLQVGFLLKCLVFGNNSAFRNKRKELTESIHCIVWVVIVFVDVVIWYIEVVILCIQVVVRGTVFARFSPEQKQQLVEALQDVG